MGKVLDINSLDKHEVSMVICLKCYKRWVCVRPQETKLVNIECKKCGQGYVIETGQNLIAKSV